MQEGKRIIDPVAKEFARRIREKLGDRLEEVILFGSQAKGNANIDSDFDILLIVKDENLPKDERFALQKLGRLIFLELGATADVLVKPRSVVERQRDKWYTVTYDAIRDGVSL